jgi:multisubunit Na+/H+ antiporter MnhE subunit
MEISITSADNRPWLVPALLVAASAVGSLAFACVTPFAAFAVAGAYALSPRAAFLTVGAVWLANQVIGFAFLGYPWTVDTALWGLAIGAAALLATALACAAMRLRSRNIALAIGIAAVAAFGIYEATLFLVSLWLGGEENFAPAIVGPLALLNLEWAAALLGCCEILRYAGVRAFTQMAGAGSGRPRPA